MRHLMRLIDRRRAPRLDATTAARFAVYTEVLRALGRPADARRWEADIRALTAE